MSAWQPISTAPKDGTPILGYGKALWSSHALDPFEWALADYEIMIVEHDGDEFRSVTQNPYSDVMRVERWMPLPEPPTADEIELGVEGEG